jgi:predicted O-methyltransferase YrrM
MNFGTAIKAFWSNYLNFKGRARRSGHLKESSNSMDQVYPNWFDITARANFERFLMPLSGKKLTALQIGAYTGDATEWLFKNALSHPESSLVDVDTWQGSNEIVHREMNWQSIESVYDSRTQDFFPKLTKHKSTSDEFFKGNVRTFDFIYIDGDHTAAAVLKDGVNAIEVISPSGIIAFDDYTWHSGKGPKFDPQPAIDEIVLRFAADFEVLEAGAQVWLKKK